MNREIFLKSFPHVANTPGGIGVLRALILDLAVGGRLVSQRSDDESATDLLKRISDERDRMVKAKEIRKSRALPGVPVTDRRHLPDGWACVRFGELFSRMGAGSTPAGGEKSYVKDGVLFLRSQNVLNSGLVLDGAARIPESTHEKMSATKVMVGDILLNITGASIGRAAVVPRDGWTTANVNQHVSVLRPLLPEVTEYLHLMICSPYFQRLIARSSPGASREGLAIKRMELFPVPIPPTAEQHRIAARVKELTGLCEELEVQQAAKAEVRTALTGATLHRISRADSALELREALASFTESISIHLEPGDGELAALKCLRQSILDLAVRGRLTHHDSSEGLAAELLEEIALERDRLVKAKAIRKPKKYPPIDEGDLPFVLPPGWRWTRGNEFFIASDSGWSPQCLAEQSGPGEWGVLKTSAVSRGVFDKAENKRLPSALQPRPQLEVKPGDFVMIRASGSKDLVGRGAIVTETDSHLMLSDKHIRLTFLSEISAQFWAILNNSTDVQNYYSAESSGTSTMSNVTRDRIGALVVPVPPLSEQLRIVESVETLLSLCDDIESQLVDARSYRRDLSASIVAHVIDDRSQTPAVENTVSA